MYHIMYTQMVLLLLYRTYDLCLIRSSFSLKGEDHHTADDLPAGRGPGVVAKEWSFPRRSGVFYGISPVRYDKYRQIAIDYGQKATFCGGTLDLPAPKFGPQNMAIK